MPRHKDMSVSTMGKPTEKTGVPQPPHTRHSVMDGIVKGDQAQIDKYIADCQAVKVKYPKPN